MAENDDMKLPATWTCRDCLHFRRCEGFIGIKGDERTCDWAPSRFKLDTIGALCRLVREGGLVMTFHGQPIEEAEVREVATTLAVARIARAVAAGCGEGDTQAVPSRKSVVVADETGEEG